MIRNLTALTLVAFGAPHAFADPQQPPVITRTPVRPTVEEAPLPTPDQPSPFWYLSGGYAFNGTEGWELELGGRVDWNDFIYFSASPANVVIFEGDAPEGFHNETFSNGNTICRDESNGQFADDELCNSEIDTEWRAAAEFQLRVADNVLIGAGGIYVIQGDIDPDEERLSAYGSMTLELTPRFAINFKGGSDYASVQARVSF